MTIRVNTRFPLVVVGSLSLLFGAAVLLVWYANVPVAPRGGRDVGNLWVVALWLLIAGAGMLFGNRIAALAVAAPFAVYWVWWLVAAVQAGPLLGGVMALLFGVVYLAPIVVAIAGWHLLSWRGWPN